jgi:predicted transcriptional regulator
MSVEDQQRLTSRIVAAFVRKNFVPTDQIGGLIGSVHSTLMGLGNPPVIEEPPRVPAVSVRRSVQADYIICIDCGYKGQMLKKHLQSRHGLSVDQYKRRWKLSSEYPTTAPNYSEYRSQLAKSLGLGRTTAPAPAASEKPARRRSASTTTGTRTSAKKATTKKASAKKSSAKKTSSRSRKSSSKVASKAATAPAGATA